MVVRTINKMITRHKLTNMAQSFNQPMQTHLSNLKVTEGLDKDEMKGEDVAGWGILLI